MEFEAMEPLHDYDAVFPWTHQIKEMICKSFPEITKDILHLFHRFLREEFEKNDWKNKHRIEMFFSSLMDFYCYFVFNVNWNKDSNMQGISVEILYYMTRTGIMLSRGGVESKWLDKIINAVNFYPGDPNDFCDVLLLIKNLRLQDLPAYKEILRFTLWKPDTSEPKNVHTFLKIMLLYRKLRALLTTKKDQEEATRQAVNVRRPSGVSEFALSLNVGFCNERSKPLNKQFLDVKLNRGELKKLLKMLFENKYDEITSLDQLLKKKKSCHKKRSSSNKRKINLQKGKVKGEAKLNKHTKILKRKVGMCYEEKSLTACSKRNRKRKNKQVFAPPTYLGSCNNTLPAELLSQEKVVLLTEENDAKEYKSESDSFPVTSKASYLYDMPLINDTENCGKYTSHNFAGTLSGECALDTLQNVSCESDANDEGHSDELAVPSDSGINQTALLSGVIQNSFQSSSLSCSFQGKDEDTSLPRLTVNNSLQTTHMVNNSTNVHINEEVCVTNCDLVNDKHSNNLLNTPSKSVFEVDASKNNCSSPESLELNLQLSPSKSAELSALSIKFSKIYSSTDTFHSLSSQDLDSDTLKKNGNRKRTKQVRRKKVKSKEYVSETSSTDEDVSKIHVSSPKLSDKKSDASESKNFSSAEKKLSALSVKSSKIYSSTDTFHSLSSQDLSDKDSDTLKKVGNRKHTKQVRGKKIKSKEYISETSSTDEDASKIPVSSQLSDASESQNFSLAEKECTKKGECRTSKEQLMKTNDEDASENSASSWDLSDENSVAHKETFSKSKNTITAAKKKKLHRRTKSKRYISETSSTDEDASENKHSRNECLSNELFISQPTNGMKNWADRHLGGKVHKKKRLGKGLGMSSDSNGREEILRNKNAQELESSNDPSDGEARSKTGKIKSLPNESQSISDLRYEEHIPKSKLLKKKCMPKALISQLNDDLRSGEDNEAIQANYDSEEANPGVSEIVLRNRTIKKRLSQMNTPDQRSQLRDEEVISKNMFDRNNYTPHKFVVKPSGILQDDKGVANDETCLEKCSPKEFISRSGGKERNLSVDGNIKKRSSTTAEFIPEVNNDFRDSAVISKSESCNLSLKLKSVHQTEDEANNSENLNQSVYLEKRKCINLEDNTKSLKLSESDAIKNYKILIFDSNDSWHSAGDSSSEKQFSQRSFKSGIHRTSHRKRKISCRFITKPNYNLDGEQNVSDKSATDFFYANLQILNSSEDLYSQSKHDLCRDEVNSKPESPTIENNLRNSHEKDNVCVNDELNSKPESITIDYNLTDSHEKDHVCVTDCNFHKNNSINSPAEIESVKEPINLLPTEMHLGKVCDSGSAGNTIAHSDLKNDTSLIIKPYTKSSQNLLSDYSHEINNINSELTETIISASNVNPKCSKESSPIETKKKSIKLQKPKNVSKSDVGLSTSSLTLANKLRQRGKKNPCASSAFSNAADQPSLILGCSCLFSPKQPSDLNANLCSEMQKLEKNTLKQCRVILYDYLANSAPIKLYLENGCKNRTIFPENIRRYLNKVSPQKLLSKRSQNCMKIRSESFNSVIYSDTEIQKSSVSERDTCEDINLDYSAVKSSDTPEKCSASVKPSFRRKKRKTILDSDSDLTDTTPVKNASIKFHSNLSRSSRKMNSSFESNQSRCLLELSASEHNFNNLFKSTSTETGKSEKSSSKSSCDMLNGSHQSIDPKLFIDFSASEDDPVSEDDTSEEEDASSRKDSFIVSDDHVSTSENESNDGSACKNSSFNSHNSFSLAKRKLRRSRKLTSESENEDADVVCSLNFQQSNTSVTSEEHLSIDNKCKSNCVKTQSINQVSSFTELRSTVNLDDQEIKTKEDTSLEIKSKMSKNRKVLSKSKNHLTCNGNLADHSEKGFDSRSMCKINSAVKRTSHVESRKNVSNDSAISVRTNSLSSESILDNHIFKKCSTPKKQLKNTPRQLFSDADFDNLMCHNFQDSSANRIKQTFHEVDLSLGNTPSPVPLVLDKVVNNNSVSAGENNSKSSEVCSLPKGKLITCSGKRKIEDEVHSSKRIARPESVSTNKTQVKRRLFRNYSCSETRPSEENVSNNEVSQELDINSSNRRPSREELNSKAEDKKSTKDYSLKPAFDGNVKSKETVLSDFDKFPLSALTKTEMILGESEYVSSNRDHKISALELPLDYGDEQVLLSYLDFPLEHASVYFPQMHQDKFATVADNPSNSINLNPICTKAIKDALAISSNKMDFVICASQQDPQKETSQQVVAGGSLPGRNSKCERDADSWADCSNLDISLELFQSKESIDSLEYLRQSCPGASLDQQLNEMGFEMVPHPSLQVLQNPGLATSAMPDQKCFESSKSLSNKLCENSSSLQEEKSVIETSNTDERIQFLHDVEKNPYKECMNILNNQPSVTDLHNSYRNNATQLFTNYRYPVVRLHRCDAEVNSQEKDKKSLARKKTSFRTSVRKKQQK